jgi:CelD/BcsL family acetyltransferase involved in cellulose biosynthesis
LLNHELERAEVSVVPLRDLEEARELWEPLAARTGNIFSSWDWADVWWRHYGAGRRLELMLVSCSERTAILPIYRERRTGLSITRFIGNGVADQLGPIAAAEDTSLATYGVAATVRDRSLFLAERIVGHDWDPPGHRTIREEVSPSIDLSKEASWGQYLASRSPNFRQQVRRRARRISSTGIRYRLAEDPDRLQVDFSALLALHREQWGETSDVFSSQGEAFHREFAARALDRGWLRLWFAELDGTPIAAWYGFRFAGVESYYQSGRDLRWNRLSVGAAILEHSIREAFAGGMSEYRLLRGDEAYKQHYASFSTKLRTIAVPQGLAARAAISGVDLLSRWRFARRCLGRFQH